MNHLVPCPECQRHVRARETSCPFCAAALDPSNAAVPALPTQRLGRAALFGLGAGGIEGVERVLEILRDETATAARLLGAAKVTDLGPLHINTRAVERDIYDGPANLPGIEGAMKGLWVKAKL